MAGPGGREAGRLTIRVAPDTSGFAGELQAFLDRIERRAQVQVEVNPDTTGFASALRAQLARVNESVDIGADLQNGDLARIRAQLANIRPRPTVHVRAEVDTDHNSISRLTGVLGRLSLFAGTAGRGMLSLTGSLAKFGSVASTIPAISGLVSGLAQMGPAAAVAAPAVLSVGQAGAALKIGMSGVTDALSGSAEAMAELTPAARDFVSQARALGPAWSEVQDSVQTALFKDLGDQLSRTANSVLPVLKTGLTGAASALNEMGAGVLKTASSMATSGALGKAMQGANDGLRNMSKLPSVVLQGLVQLGAAAAPVFTRMTAAMDKGLSSLSKKMTSAFESGAMQTAIERAVGLVKMFATTLRDIGSTLANVFGPAADAGAGFLPILAKLAATAKQVTASPEAQQTFQALFTTLAAVGSAISGVLGAALRAVMPLFSTLVTTISGPLNSALATIGPAIQGLVAALGAGLQPIVAALSSAFATLLPIVSQLVASLAEALGPVLTSVGELIGQLVTTLMGALAPVLAQLPALIQPILTAFSTLAPVILGIVTQIIGALAPAFRTIGTVAGELMAAVAPLITILGEGLAAAFRFLQPAINAVIPVITRIASVLATGLAVTIRAVVIPAIKMIAALLKGDFRSAGEIAKAAMQNLGRIFVAVTQKLAAAAAAAIPRVLQHFIRLAARAPALIVQMGARVVSAGHNAMVRLASSIASGVGRAVSHLAGLPRRAAGAMGNVGGVLVSAGRRLIQGFISGISSMIGAVKSKLSSLTSMLPDWKGPAPLDARILTPNGRLVLGGFIKGIEDRVPALRSALGGITAGLPDLVGKASVVGTFTAEQTGLQPGDRIVLSPDGRAQFDAYVDRLADSRIRNGLGNPANLGRK